jgi:uncharacterized protein (DUF58 family)
MNFSLKDRHLVGAGAAACAVCCAAPILTVLGIAGAAATVATFIFAGLVFGVVVASGAAFAVWNQRRRSAAESSCTTVEGPQDVEMSLAPPARER